ncbi:MAG: enoyl-CoA hydratase [Acidobacteriaceae bacterium]|nr:enoyl-CoA hydratase [Acidobacteriaceae bacterium]
MSQKSVVLGLESLKQFRVVEEVPGFWRATFNNPPVNLYDPDTFLELRSILDKTEETTDVKVLVFDSADPDYFISHYDLVRATEVPEKPSDDHVYGWARLFTRFNESPVVTIASIRGATRGIGNEFALALDMRFASKEKARFAQIEVGFGCIPGGGGIDWLSALSGRARTIEIVCGGNDFDATTAADYGWINRAFPDADLDAFVDNLAKRIATFDRPALELAKRMINSRVTMPRESERWSSMQQFLHTITWPATQARFGKSLELGLQKTTDFELNLGTTVVNLRPE